MDTTILEVVLGLALIYATLAMLVMQLQEQVGGNLLNYRSNVLHDLVLEACGQSQDLKQQVLAQPLVFALYREQQAEQRGMLPDKGPSAIPPTLFAKALLAALNGGTAPALAHASPALFMAGAAPPVSATTTVNTVDSSADGQGRLRVWQALQALLPGHETDWAGFEAAIAAWFKDIGDRSEGWFKRKTSRWALTLSLLVVLALNVDSFHIANTLGQDPALRLGLADLAARVDSQRRSDAAGSGDQPAPPSAAAQPMQQLASRMTDAITRLNSAFADKAIGGFQTDLTPVYLACSIVREPSALNEAHPLTTEVNTAIKAALASSAVAGKQAAKEDKPPVVVDGLPAWTASLSNADVWLRVLPIVQAKVEVAQLLPAAQAERIYRRGFECVAQVSSWVRSATVHSNSANVRTQMQDAAVALESVKSALLTLAERQPPTLSLRRAFVTNPEAFDSCASNARDSRSSFDACLQRELRSGWNLPLFWGGSAMRGQFCDAVASWPVEENMVASKTAPQDKPKEEKQAADNSMFCGGTSFAGDAKLGLPALRLQARGGWPWLAAILGWLTTILFVALGAPFWFDLIGKVARLRSAGTVRDAEADAQRGRGTLPLPAPTSGSGSSAAGGTGDGETPFSDSRNAFEDTLVPAAILRLQQKLPADATGRLDLQTRAALRSWCSANGVTPVEELDEPLYRRIVGRAASVATAGTGSARLQLGQANAQLPALATALMKVLRQPGRTGATATVFNDDLRALAVLFRYHQDRRAGKAPRDCSVLQLPNSNPAQLDQVDELLITQIDAAAGSNQAITLEPPCWMDWAIGELGQVENNAPSRAGSNQRICAYLDEAQARAGDGGDRTPWCGAFVAWVLKSYDSYRRVHLADNERGGDPLSGANSTWTLPVGDTQQGWPLTAAAWATWGTTRANWPQQARFGDVVLLKSQGGQSSGHVGFFIAWDGKRIWLLGGNQTSGSRVSVQSWDGSEVVAVRQA